MSVPALGGASLSQGPSCVHHFTLITVLIFVATVASDVPQNLCRQDPATFASQIHTIGFIDDALWAITKSDWNVYKLTPCDAGIESLVHCMKVDPPVEADTKWPQLVESAKSAAKATDLTFFVDNSAVMDSSEFEHKVLAMRSASFKDSFENFGFDFVTSKSVITNDLGGTNISQGLWISSDEKDKAFRFFDSGRQVENIRFHKNVDEGKDKLLIQPCDPRTIWKICKPGSNGDQVQFKKDGACDPIDWSTVSKGVFFQKQFYLFASDLVYIFSDQAETESTKLRSVSFKDFFKCTEPTTLAPHPDPSSGNATTYERISANSSHMTTAAAKGSNTIYIIIVSVVLVLVVILIFGCVYYYLYLAKPPTDGKSDGNSKLASSSPKDSKVITKARTVSKGSYKQSQTKCKTFAY